MERAGTQKLPESVELMILDSSGRTSGWTSCGITSAMRTRSCGADVYSQEGGQDGPYGQLLSEGFGFDELTIEDCFTEGHLPKVDDYGEYLFVVLFSFGISGGNRSLKTAEVDMYVGRNYVVCVHPNPVKELGRVREKLRAGDELVSSSASRVAVGRQLSAISRQLAAPGRRATRRGDGRDGRWEQVFLGFGEHALLSRSNVLADR